MQQYVDKIKHILTHNSIDINYLNNSESKVLKTLMEDTLQYTQIVYQYLLHYNWNNCVIWQGKTEKAYYK